MIHDRVVSPRKPNETGHCRCDDPNRKHIGSTIALVDGEACVEVRLASMVELGPDGRWHCAACGGVWVEGEALAGRSAGRETV